MPFKDPLIGPCHETKKLSCMVALGGQGQRLEAAPPRGPALNSRLLALVLVFVAEALRVWQYAAGTSMWMDELWIASNVLPRSTADLLRRPLDFGQVAPLGFLLLTKWSTLALGSTEYALRLLPFLAALASVVLFWRLACRAPSQPVPQACLSSVFRTPLPLCLPGLAPRLRLAGSATDPGARPSPTRSSCACGPLPRPFRCWPPSAISRRPPLRS